MSKNKMIVAGVLLLLVSVAAGYLSGPEEFRVPVLLADGEVIQQPCYVTVEDECVALVDSEETAQNVMEMVKSEYKSDKTIDVRIQEETSVKDMVLENGDAKPEVLTEKEAAQQLVDSEKITVETTDVITEGVTKQYETVVTESEELNVGETQIIQNGVEGFSIIVKEVFRENGEVTSERVVSEKIIDEPVDEIIMCGIAGLENPLQEMRVTSGFGFRWGRQHEGVDLGVPEGSSVYAARAGTVSYAGYNGGYGYLVKLDHGGNLETYYAHCSKLLVSEGQYVEAGDVIAKSGSTGRSTGPHLHFEVRVNGVAEDPQKWIAGMK